MDLGAINVLRLLFGVGVHVCHNCNVYVLRSQSLKDKVRQRLSGVKSAVSDTSAVLGWRAFVDVGLIACNRCRAFAALFAWCVHACRCDTSSHASRVGCETNDRCVKCARQRTADLVVGSG
jgi:hypothetical protein